MESNLIILFMIKLLHMKFLCGLVTLIPVIIIMDNRLMIFMICTVSTVNTLIFWKEYQELLPVCHGHYIYILCSHLVYYQLNSMAMMATFVKSHRGITHDLMVHINIRLLLVHKICTAGYHSCLHQWEFVYWILGVLFLDLTNQKVNTHIISTYELAPIWVGNSHAKSTLATRPSCGRLTIWHLREPSTA